MSSLLLLYLFSFVCTLCILTPRAPSYFSRPYLEGDFLKDPKHAELIDRDVLESYYHVGGVRIEDCILVTDDGHENLTTAPKGEEALKIIDGDAE